MEANGGAAKRSSLVDAVDAARAGDAEAADAVVALCRPELLRLARSIDAAKAERVVDELLASFVAWLDHLQFDKTPEVWFYLYQGCRELMSGGTLAAPPEPTTPPELIESTPELAPAVEPVTATEPVAVAAMATEPDSTGPVDDGGARTELIGTSTVVLQPRRLSVAERLSDAVSARRSFVTASLLTAVLVASTVVAATQWDTMHVLDDVNLVSVDGEDVAETLIPAAVEGGSDPQSPLGPGPASDDGGRAVFTPPSDPIPAGSTTTSEVAPESTTITTSGSTTTVSTTTAPSSTDSSTTTAPSSTTDPSTTSTSTTVVPPTGPRDSLLTTTTAPLVTSSSDTSLVLTTNPAVLSP